MVHWVKDLVLSLLWPWSLLWYGCNPWPGSYHMPQVQPKKERKKKKLAEGYDGQRQLQRMNTDLKVVW